MGYDPVTPSGFDPASGIRQFEAREESLRREKEIEEMQAPVEKDAEGFLELVGGSARYTVFGTAAEKLVEPEFEANINFEPEKMVKEDPRVENLPTPVMLALKDTVSPEHYEHVMQEAELEMEHQALVSSYGILGYTADMLTGIALDLPFDALTGGLTVISKGTRLKRALKGAATMGAMGAATQAYIASNKHTMDETDVLYSALLTGGVGAGLGVAFGGHWDQLADADIKRINKEQMDVMDKELIGEDTTELINKHTKDVLTRRINQGKLEDSIEIEDEMLDFAKGSVGAAARVDPKGVFKTSTPEFRADLPTAPERVKRLDRIGIGDAARLGRSASEYMRGLAGKLLNQSSGPMKGTTLDTTAAIRAQRYNNHLSDALHKPIKKAQKSFNKAEGAEWCTPKKAFETELRWEDALIEEMNAREFGFKAKHEGLSIDSRKAVSEAADALDETHIRQADIQNISGATKDMPYKSGYFSRHWNGSAVNNMAQGTVTKPGIGLEGVQQLFEKGIRDGARRSGLEDLPELFKEMSKAITKRFLDKGAKLDATELKKLSLNSKEDLLEILEGAGASTEILEQADKFMTVAQPDKAGPSHLKKRMTIDLSATLTSASGHEYKLMDLVSKNMQQNVARHNRTVAGLTALNDVGFENAEAVKKLIVKAQKTMADDWQSLGFKSADEASRQAKKEALLLEANVDLLMGKVPDGGVSPEIKRAMEVVQDFTNISSLGLMGIVQIAESGRIFAANGVMNVIKTIPQLKNMYRQLADGTTASPLLREMEYAVGFKSGDDVARNPYILRQELGNIYAMEGTPGLYDRGMAAAKNFIGKVSGQEYIMQLQNKIQFESMANKFLELAQNPNKVNMAQMRELGLDDKVLDKVLSNIKKHGTTDEPMGMRKWDFQTREKFADAIMVANSTQIQQQLVGDLQAWMYNPIGKLLTQFRTFTLGAIDKQSVRFFKSDNRSEQIATFIYSAAVGSMLYCAKLNINTLGMSSSQRRKYLEARLTPLQITKGSAQMLGQLSGVPEIVDKIGILTGGFAGLGAGRGTAGGYQGASDALVGISPAAAMVKRSIQATQAASGLLTGQDVSGSNKKALVKTLVPDNLATRIVGNIVAQ